MNASELSSPADIPVIDISALAGPDEAAHLSVVAQIGAACRGTGFFVITNHGVSAEAMRDALDIAHDVFALPMDIKRGLAIATHGHNRGYVGLGVEALDEKTAPDMKEAFNLIWTDEKTRVPNVWPPIAGWRERAQSYIDATLAVGQRLHKAFAADLGLEQDFFADKVDKPLATLRFLHYPAGNPALAAENQPGAGTHTDYGNVTLLATDGVAGLQVQRRDGTWLDAPALPGAFICNIGDCLMRWTNNVYVSTPHRVLPPPRERYSIAFFLDPNPDAVVSALPTCVSPEAPAKYAPITTAEYLKERFAATYGKK